MQAYTLGYKSTGLANKSAVNPMKSQGLVVKSHVFIPPFSGSAGQFFVPLGRGWSGKGWGQVLPRRSAHVVAGAKCRRGETG